MPIKTIMLGTLPTKRAHSYGKEAPLRGKGFPPPLENFKLPLT